jgi:hypothetical protein
METLLFSWVNNKDLVAEYPGIGDMHPILNKHEIADPYF